MLLRKRVNFYHQQQLAIQHQVAGYLSSGTITKFLLPISSSGLTAFSTQLPRLSQPHINVTPLWLAFRA
jgi:hypothetical protein